MRILILTISYPPNVGGVETHLQDLVDWLSSQKDLEVHLLTYQPITTQARGARMEKKGCVTLFRIPWFGKNLFHRLESKPLFQFLYLAPRLLLAAFFHLLRHGSFHVIHAHGLVSIWTANQVKRFWKIPVLGSIHAVYAFSDQSSTAPKIIQVLKGADRILTLSDSSIQQLQRYGFHSKALKRFTYWVDLQVFHPIPRQEGRKRFQLPMEPSLCLFVGRLLKIKGIELILELAKKMPELLFIIAGNGPMETECQKAAQHLPNLRFLGPIPNHDLPFLYGASDLLLIPSQYEEGFGRVACEAMACGLPVLASRRGGLVEALNGSPSMLTEPTVESFQKSIEDWFKKSPDPSVRDHCRKFAEEKFSSRNAREIEDHMRELAHLTESS